MDKENETRSIQLTNEIGQLPDLVAFIENLSEDWKIPQAFAMSLNLVLEEAFTNVVFYAFKDEKQHLIDLKFEKNDKLLKITLSDDGREYDPLQKDDPNFAVPLEERTVGGLGIFLIKKIMDNVYYERKENRNYLILTKILR